MNELKEYNKSIFETIKHVDENNNEYWYARELQKVLEYKRWEKFCIIINKSQISCLNSNNKVDDHFPQVEKMVNIGSKTSRKIIDYKLS